MKKRGPIKLSGLIQAGAVVPQVVDVDPEPAPLEPKRSATLLSLLEQSTTYDTGKVLRQLELHLIDANPLAPREIYTEEMIRKRAEDLRTQGQHDPIHVIPHPDASDRFIIADGWTRVLACRTHQVQDTLVAEIHNDLNLRQAAWFGYEQNEGRTQQCDFDKAMFYERLLQAGESQAELATRANLSRTMLTYYRAYARLPRAVTDIIRKHPERFGSLVAYNLQRLNDALGSNEEAQLVALTQKFAEGDFSVKWLTTYVATQLKQTRPTTLPSTATALRQVRYANGGYKLKGNTVEMSIKVNEEQREIFIDALERLLSTVGINLAEPMPTADSHEQG